MSAQPVKDEPPVNPNVNMNMNPNIDPYVNPNVNINANANPNVNQEGMREGEVMTCSLDNIKKISKESEKGALLIFTQEGCPHCPPFLEEVKKTVGDQITVVEAGLEDAECLGLADQLGATATPAAYFFKDGEKKEEINPVGKTWDEVRQELRRLVEQSKNQAK